MKQAMKSLKMEFKAATYNITSVIENTFDDLAAFIQAASQISGVTPLKQPRLIPITTNRTAPTTNKLS